MRGRAGWKAVWNFSKKSSDLVAPPFPNYKDGDDNDDGDTAVGSCENTDSARQKKRESGIEQFSAKEIFF